jgi:4-oxalocrotonate tautomerase
LRGCRPRIKPDDLSDKGFFTSDFIYFSSFLHPKPAGEGYITCVVDTLGAVAECSAAELGEESQSIKSKGDEAMPLVTVKVIEGVFTDSQKREMVKKLTDAMVSIEGENMRQVTWVMIEEVKSGDLGIGGTPLTTEDVKALASGR